MSALQCHTSCMYHFAFLFCNQHCCCHTVQKGESCVRLQNVMQEVAHKLHVVFLLLYAATSTAAVIPCRKVEIA